MAPLNSSLLLYDNIGGEGNNGVFEQKCYYDIDWYLLKAPYVRIYMIHTSSSVFDEK